tara:strand:+ start:6558 stop:7373 length:816 start_codon:yes stop_codon:yes gene_type:complete
MGAITATTIISLGLAAAKAGASFAQASKQKKMQQKAEREADKFMSDARKKIGVNYYEGLSLQKEPYERAREAMLASGQQALQVAQEGESRGAAAAAGRVQMAQGDAQRRIATDQAERLLSLEKLAAGEDSRIAGLLSDLDLQEAEGAQIAAREAAINRAAATQQAMEGVGEFIGAGLEALPLYQKDAAARQLGRSQRIAGRTGQYGELQDIKNTLAQQGMIDGVDVSAVGGMSDLEFKDFIGQQDRSFGRAMRRDALGLSGFNPFDVLKRQ